MNKHLKIAFFIAPLLAIGGYVMTGYVVTTKPVNKSLPVNQASQLRAQGDCLPTENSCQFSTAELQLRLISNEQKNQQQLAVISTEVISNLSLALGQGDTFKQFPMMKSEDNKYWQIKLNPSDKLIDYTQLRLALTHQEKNYFIQSEVNF